MDGPEGVEDIASLRSGDAAAALTARGFAETTVERGVDSDAVRQITVPAGKCVGLVVAGDEGLADVDLVALEGAGERIASDTGPAPWASISWCAGDEAESVRFEVIPYAGQGAVELRWMERTP